MRGVSYITDEKNRKKAVVIDLKTLKEHDDQIGDLFDVIIAESRRDEPSVSWEELKKRLKEKREAVICTSLHLRSQRKRSLKSFPHK